MKRKFKKAACVLSLAFAVCACQMFVGGTPVFAQTQNAGFSNVAMTNSSFDSNPTSSYLDSSPSGWTSGNGNAKKGIINVNEINNSFAYNCTSNYHLNTTENPGKVGEDDKVLMISSRVANVKDTTTKVFDHFTSNEITLDAYSYYRISVWVSTHNSAHASVVLEGLEEDDRLALSGSTYFSDIQTTGSNEWREYAYYIQTNAQTQKVKLKLALGTITESNQIQSSGVAFFDETSVIECSQTYYQTLISNESSSLANFSEIAYDKHDITPSLNLDFEQGLDKWEMFGTYENNASFTANVVQTNKIFAGSDYSLNNQKALLLSAEKTSPVHVGFKSEPFSIKSANIYRISVMAKADSLVGSATINLVETDYLEKTYSNSTAPTTSTITITTTNQNQLTNDYQEFVFYVSGYELYDTEMCLELSLGEENVPAYGSIAFDSIKISQYSYDDFQNADTSSEDVKKITLSTITSSPSFENGAFNSAHGDGVHTNYPLTPNSWSVSEDDKEGTTFFGVVNTSKWNEMDSEKRPTTSAPANPSIEMQNGQIVPMPQNAPNNILMLHNKAASRQVVTSPSFTLEKNKFYSLTFNYFNFGDALTIKILDADKNVVFEDKAISTTAWQTYKVMFRTEHFAVETLNIVFELDNQTSNQKAYTLLDNFQLYEPTSYTAEKFQTDITNGLNTIDLSNLGIHQKGEYNSITNVYDATLFNGNLESGTQVGSQPIAFGGIINETNNFGIEFPATHTNAVKNMIALQTLAIADYSLASKNTIALTSGTYYKFSIYVKTSFTTAPTNEQDFGAYFKIVGVENAVLKNIISGTLFDQYTIYISTESDVNVNVLFGLKSETVANQSAFFDSFEFTTVEKVDFENAVNSNNVLVLNNAPTTEDDSEDDSSSAATGGNFWIEMSTIVMIIAIVIAVVGGLLRKTRIKKFKIKKQAEYTKQASQFRDAAMVEAEKRRSEEVSSLVKEKEQLASYLKELEADNKKRLAENRKVSGKVITRKAEKEFKIYASNRQKIVRDMGRIDERIKEAQTPEYLNRIAKIIQTEKVKQMHETTSTPVAETPENPDKRED